MKKIRSFLAVASLLTVSTVAGFAGTITEDFATDPLPRGWQFFGDTNLFHWNSTNQNLEVTWDSTQPNSYFYLPLGATVTKSDAFTVSFDLRLDDVATLNYGQQIALGLLNFQEATNAGFSRPNTASPDLFEFDYYPATDYYPVDSVDATLADLTVNPAVFAGFAFAYTNAPLQNGITYHIVLAHPAGAATVSGQVFTNGVLCLNLTKTSTTAIADFQLNTFSVTSYADDGYGDDILAHGTVDNIQVAFTPSASTTVLTENFFSDPLQRGWQIFGNTNLFFWDNTNQTLAVTWDSSTSNSYCYRPLGTTLTPADAFALDFDIQLKDLQSVNTFQIAVGLLNYSNATDPRFSRPIGTSPNLFEFNYFADNGYREPDFAATMTGSTASLADYPDFYFIYDVQPMNPATIYHVRILHAAGSGILTGAIFANGQVYASMSKSYPGTIHDFQLDTLSINSYSGTGQNPAYAGSILAHGWVDNFVVTLPPPSRNLACAFDGSHSKVSFASLANWTYTLERSTDLVSWSDASAPVAGAGGTMTLSDSNGPSTQAFYRIRAAQP